MIAASPPPAQPPNTRQIPRWPGWLCLVPALLLLLFQLVVPSVRVLVASFQSGGAFEPASFVGLQNYQQLFGADASAWVPTVIIAIVIMVVAWVPALLIGILGGRATGWQAVLIRIGLAAMLVCYAPASMAVLLIDNPSAGSPPGSYLLVIGLYLPIVVAGTAVIALAVFADGVGPGVPAAAALAGFGLLASIAWALQLVDPALILGSGAVGRSPAATSWQLGLVRFDFGLGQAQNALVLIVLGVLGLLATLLILISRIEIDLAPSTSSTSVRPAPVAAVAAVLATAVVLLLMLIMNREWVAGLFQLKTELIRQVGPEQVLKVIVNTWVPPLLATLPQVAVAVAAGAAIGLFRPFGRHSRWILLAFAPWLFTGIQPLLLIYFADLSRLGLLNLWIDLVPRIWVVGPAVIAFSLLFDGVRRHREATGSYRGSTVVIAGLALLIAAVLMIVQSQALGWVLAVALSPELMNGSGFLFQMVHQVFGQADAVLTWLSFPLPLVVLVGAAVAVGMILFTGVRISAFGRVGGNR